MSTRWRQAVPYSGAACLSPLVTRNTNTFEFVLCAGPLTASSLSLVHICLPAVHRAARMHGDQRGNCVPLGHFHPHVRFSHASPYAIIRRTIHVSCPPVSSSLSHCQIIHVRGRNPPDRGAWRAAIAALTASPASRSGEDFETFSTPD